jgi:hypothetical protein
LIASPLDEERIIEYRFHRPTLMVLVDEAQQQEGHGHARAPVEEQERHLKPRPAETARREMLRSFFNMPLWLRDSLIVIGMSTIIIAAVMLIVDLFKAFVRGGDADGDLEDGDGEEVVPLLAQAEPAAEQQQQHQHQLSETERLAEEAVKPNPEALVTCSQEAPKSAEQLQPTEES